MNIIFMLLISIMVTHSAQVFPKTDSTLSSSQHQNLLTNIEDFIESYSKKSSYQKMILRNNLIFFLNRLKTRYTDTFRSTLIDKCLSHIKELDYLEIKKPQDAQMYITSKKLFIEKL